MKTIHYLLGSRLFALLVWGCAPHGLDHAAFAQGTVFSYQSRLMENGLPAHGNYDLRFELRDAPTGGGAIGPALTNAPVAVSNGVFEVTLDFGAAAFPGAPRWLELGVRTNGNAAAHTILSPRQPVLSVPHAIQSLNAGTAATLTGTLPATALTGTVPAALIPGLDAAKLASGTVADARLSANVPRLSLSALFAADVGAARLNAGISGMLTGTLSGIGGGFLNTNHADYATIGGGNKNLISIGATYSAVGGGQNNLILGNAQHGTIPGGSQNTVGGMNSFAAGTRAKALHPYSFVWNDAAGADLATTTNNQFLISAVNGIQFFSAPNAFRINGQPVLAGLLEASNVVGGTLAVDRLAVGSRAYVNGAYSSVMGGFLVTNDASYAVLAGGNQNLIATGASHAALGGGQRNVISNNAQYATIPGGSGNVAAGLNSFAAGVNAHALHNYSFVWNDAAGTNLASTMSNEFSVRGANAIRFFTGNPANFTVNGLPVLAGVINASNVSGGDLLISSLVAGNSNVRSGNLNGIGGGFLNTNLADYATVAGGNQNLVVAGASYAALGGGQGNVISNNAQYATIPGGSQNTVAGVNSFAAGVRAHALHDYSFVWNSAAGSDLATTNSHQFLVNAQNGVQFITGNKGMTVDGQAVLAGTIDASKVSGGVLRVSRLNSGEENFLTGLRSSVLGGNLNTNTANDSTVGGGLENQITSGAFFSWLGSGRSNAILGTSILAVLGGGLNNAITNSFASVMAGGSGNRIESGSQYAVLGGGLANVVSNDVYVGTISGGGSNSVASSFATIGGGLGNRVIGTDAFEAVISGGYKNTITNGGAGGVVAGGRNNVVGPRSVVSGGSANHALGFGSVVPGGFGNRATGEGSFAAGVGATAQHQGTFVWSDYTSSAPSSTSSNQFLIFAAGGVGIGTSAPGSPVTVQTGASTYGFEHTDGTIRLATYLGGAAGGGWIGTRTSHPLNFYVGDGSAAMTVSPTENVGIGTTNPGYKLHVNGSVAGTGAYISLSDARYKTNVATLTGALDRVLALRGVEFDWLREKFPALDFETSHQLGFIAQELQQVLPEAVSTDAQGVQSVAYTKVVPVLVEALKEQKRATDAALRSRDAEVASLKQDIAELKRLVGSLAAQAKGGAR